MCYVDVAISADVSYSCQSGYTLKGLHLMVQLHEYECKFHDNDDEDYSCVVIEEDDDDIVVD